jgi:outer membrane protein assembly factor BamB
VDAGAVWRTWIEGIRSSATIWPLAQTMGRLVEAAGGKVYTLGAMGLLACWDVQSGERIWSHDLSGEFNAKVPTWGFAGQPLVDRNKLICLAGRENACVIAFHKDTGAEIWRALSAPEPGYSAPVIFEVGGCRQLIVW